MQWKAVRPGLILSPGPSSWHNRAMPSIYEDQSIVVVLLSLEIYCWEIFFSIQTIQYARYYMYYVFHTHLKFPNFSRSIFLFVLNARNVLIKSVCSSVPSNNFFACIRARLMTVSPPENALLKKENSLQSICLKLNSCELTHPPINYLSRLAFSLFVWWDFYNSLTEWDGAKRSTDNSK